MRLKIINSTGRPEDTQAIDMDSGVALPVELVKLDLLMQGSMPPPAPLATEDQEH